MGSWAWVMAMRIEEKSEPKKYFKAKFLNLWTIWGYKDNYRILNPQV